MNDHWQERQDIIDRFQVLSQTWASRANQAWEPAEDDVIRGLTGTKQGEWRHPETNDLLAWNTGELTRLGKAYSLNRTYKSVDRRITIVNHFDAEGIEIIYETSGAGRRVSPKAAKFSWSNAEVVRVSYHAKDRVLHFGVDVPAGMEFLKDLDTHQALGVCQDNQFCEVQRYRLYRMDRNEALAALECE